VCVAGLNILRDLCTCSIHNQHKDDRAT